MSDFAMALWAMTAAHHHWSAPPPKEPVAVVRTAEDINPSRELSELERAALKQSLERTARCATGRLIYDPEIGLYVPEFRRGCLPPSSPPKRQQYHASQLASPAMIAMGRKLIVNISFWAAQKHIGNVGYGVSKAATDKKTADMSTELRISGEDER